MSTPPFICLPLGVHADRWTVRGSERAILHAGMAEAGTWVVMVPGFTGSKEDFIAVLPHLADSGIGAVAFDQLGQYESDGSDRAEDYALESLAADVAEVADIAARTLGRADAPHLLGHSFGGLVAQEAVAAGLLAPASLIALCTGPGALPPERWASLPDLVAALEHHDLATIWRIMREMERAEEATTPSPEVAAFLERRWHANSAVGLQQFGLLLMNQPELVSRVAARVAGGLTMSVIWGERDDAWPIPMQVRMAERLGVPGLELPGVGHSPNTDDPALLASVLLRLLRE